MVSPPGGNGGGGSAPPPGVDQASAQLSILIAELVREQRNFIKEFKDLLGGSDGGGAAAEESIKNLENILSRGATTRAVSGLGAAIAPEDTLDEITNKLEKQLDLQKRILDAAGEEYSQLDLNLQQQRDYLSVLKKKLNLEYQRPAAEEREAEIKQIQEQYEQTTKNIAALERQQLIKKRSVDITEDLFKSIGLAARAEQTALGGLAISIGTVASSSETALDVAGRTAYAIGRGLVGAVFSLFDEMIVKTIGFQKVLEDATASIAKLGFVSEAVSSNLIVAAEGSLALGVGAKEAQEAMSGLTESSVFFTSTAGNFSNELTTLTGKFAVLDVSVSTIAQNIDNLAIILGKAESQIASTQEEVANFAMEIGVSFKRAMEDFASSSKLLVFYGEQGIEVFKNLERAARETGMSMTELDGIVGGSLDTFEGSARAAGKLNAVLGGNLINSVELLTAREDERREILRGALLESGKTFNTLGKYEKITIAAAAGINDLTQAEKFFTNNTQEAASQTEGFEEALKKAQTIGSKFKKLLEVLTVTLEPYFELISDGLTSVIEFADEHRDLIQVFVGVAGVLAAGAVGYKAYELALTKNVPLVGSIIEKLKEVGPAAEGGSGGVGAAAESITEAIEGASDAVEESSKSIIESISNAIKELSAAANTPGFLKLAWGIAIVVASMALFIGSLGFLAEKLAGIKEHILAFGVSVSLIIFTMGLLIVGILAFAPQAAIATSVIIYMAVGIAMLAGVFMLLGVGINQIFKPLNEFLKNITLAGQQIGTLTVELYTFFALISVQSDTPFVKISNNFNMITDSVSDLIDKMQQLDTASLNSLNTLFSHFKDLQGDVTYQSKISAVADDMEKIVNVVQDKPDTIDKVSEILNIINNVGEQNISPSPAGGGANQSQLDKILFKPTININVELDKDGLVNEVKSEILNMTLDKFNNKR